MLEENVNNAPTIFHVASPFDTVSKKAPQQALVWQNGKLLLNIDYTDYADMRTGAMDAISLQLSSIRNLSGKKILIFGTGKTARWSIKINKAIFNDLSELEYINSTNTQDSSFESFCSELGIIAKVGSYNEVSTYDCIFCHTSSKEPVLGAEYLNRIKKGCVISTFVSSSNFSEVDDSFFCKRANVVADWENNISRMKELNRMVEKGGLSKENIITLRDLLEGKRKLDDKDFTVFRFLGTPMQNLAVLKILLGE